MFTRTLRRVGLALTAALLVSPAFAAVVTSFDDIALWTGTGANRAALVIDWNDGTATRSFAWGFRWDGSATGRDLLAAVAGSIGTNTTPALPDGSGDPALTLFTQAFSFGTIVFQLDYVADGVAHSRGGFEPESTGYWAYYVASGTDLPTTWTPSMVGFDDRTLVNNAWDGWSWAPDFVGTAPTAPVAAVPEPGALILLGLGGAILLWQIRRRARA